MLSRQLKELALDRVPPRAQLRLRTADNSKRVALKELIVLQIYLDVLWMDRPFMRGKLHALQ
jgi:hypothetical protein